MKTEAEILERIRETLVNDFELPAGKITPEARFFEDLDLDSIDAVDLIVRLRNETGLAVNAEDFKAIRTIGDLVSVLARLIAERGK